MIADIVFAALLIYHILATRSCSRPYVLKVALDTIELQLSVMTLRIGSVKCSFNEL